MRRVAGAAAKLPAQSFAIDGGLWSAALLTASQCSMPVIRPRSFARTAPPCSGTLATSWGTASDTGLRPGRPRLPCRGYRAGARIIRRANWRKRKVEQSTKQSCCSDQTERTISIAKILSRPKSRSPTSRWAVQRSKPVFGKSNIRGGCGRERLHIAAKEVGYCFLRKPLRQGLARAALAWVVSTRAAEGGHKRGSHEKPSQPGSNCRSPHRNRLKSVIITGKVVIR
jgi:hypothetical protein